MVERDISVDSITDTTMIEYDRERYISVGSLSIEEIQRHKGSEWPNVIVCRDLNTRISQLNEYTVLDDGHHIETLPNKYVGNFNLP